jgi:hypothetical protein
VRKKIMISGRFKGYTYTEYQNEMCNRAIESGERELELLEKARDSKSLDTVHKASYHACFIGISEINRRIEHTKKSLEYLRAVRNSNGQIIEPIYKRYWDNVYHR